MIVFKAGTVHSHTLPLIVWSCCYYFLFFTGESKDEVRKLRQRLEDSESDAKKLRDEVASLQGT